MAVRHDCYMVFCGMTLTEVATCDILQVGEWVTEIAFNIAPCLAVRFFNDSDTQFVFICVLIIVD